MATKDVHEALKTLSPTNHTEFPTDSSTLQVHLESSLVDTHILISSIPPPAMFPKNLDLPEPPNADSKALQKEWKPVKLSAKENPLGISLFKLSAKDGKGSWFARRSIHTEIPFEQFKAGLLQEFEQPASGAEENASGSIRGITKDSKVHYETCELGTAEILQLSAQFPGPSAPREFVEGRISTWAYPPNLSVGNAEMANKVLNKNTNQTDKMERPKQFAILSTPVLNHPECNERPGYVRATYESVEFIREVPVTSKSLERSHSTRDIASLHFDGSPSRPRGKSVGQASQKAAPLKHCPVDWIMITRSDPGGNVPRWMVERATPGAIIKDAEKFLKWCVNTDQLRNSLNSSVDNTIPESRRQQISIKEDELKETTREKNSARKVLIGGDCKIGQESTVSLPVQESNSGAFGSSNGFLSNAIGSVAAGIASLTHAKNQSDNPTPLPNASSEDVDDSLPHSSESTNKVDESDDTISTCSFATCDSDPLSRTVSEKSTTTSGHNHSLSEDRTLARFFKEKLKLEEMFKKDENRHAERDKKLMEKHLKNMEKQERKFKRAVEKSNQREKKEQERRNYELSKKLDPELNRRKEMEEMRRLVESLVKENLELRSRICELEAGQELNIKPGMD